MLNPPFWAMHPYACDTLLFENITFEAPVTSPNTDGIDPDSCSNVVIRNFNVNHCGDDAVAIKSGKDSAGRAFGRPSYNILIEGKLDLCMLIVHLHRLADVSILSSFVPFTAAFFLFIF